MLIWIFEVLIVVLASAFIIVEIAAPLFRGTKFFPVWRALAHASTPAEKALRAVREQSEEVRTLEEAQDLDHLNRSRVR